jgi:hypothetical protein
VKSTTRVFILSPAHCGGERARLVYRDEAQFDLARRLRTSAGAALGEVFCFLSGLYFRGKLAYASAFAKPPRRSTGTLVITTNRGLLPSDTIVTLDDLRQMATGDIDGSDPSYCQPLIRDAKLLAAALGETGTAVLLGSVASGKYVDVLLEVFGERLMFPEEFIGRGDMSRGGLMLRCIDEQRELTYIPVAGAVRRGRRPPKLEKRKPLMK